jgi:nucleotidyltransferase/DNA polymerase involved in DNA repair
MRIACIRVPTFAVAVEQLADPALARQPLVVVDGKAVLDASTDLTRVHRGLSSRRAKALYPQATFVEANQALLRDVFDEMLDALERVAPEIEPVGLGCAYADVRGLYGHYEDEFRLAGALVETVREATGLLPSVGVAEGKFVAWVAASSVDPCEAGIVTHGQESEFLRDKNVEIFPIDPELVQRLNILALRTLGDIAALPRPAFEAQFRRIGGRLWELANGIDREPLRARKPQELLIERLIFDTPVVAVEALLAASRQIVARLVRRLDGRAARRMHLQLLADERIVWERVETFREPTGDERGMLLLLKTRLSLLELPQAVDTASITLSGIGREVAKQAKLFTNTQQNLNQIGEAIRQLRARYGRDMVGRVMEVDPWSRHPEERNILVPYDI